MLLSLVLHTYSMRYVLPAAVMMGTAPTYVLAWGAWRLLSAVLPARFYREVDDRLYTIYQSMVLFFFENYTGVQVIQGFRLISWDRRPLLRGQRRICIQIIILHLSHEALGV
uniref:1-acyl-sn-glycerol-3-phosphate acyltransferase epsilon n=1 Tax=Accipiter nisus TaxID=211598 RepID=A0A8B9NC21_9AVES